MVARLRVLSALCALVTAVILVFQSSPAGRPMQVHADDLPMTNVTTSIKWPVIETTDPEPFNPCKEIPYDVVAGLGLAFTPPIPEDSLRCKYDAGNYQMAVEPIVWRSYEGTLPPDAVELDIDGHRAAQWWITCMIAFDTSYGVLQQSVFYSPIYSNPDPDCMQTNLQRAHELIPHYVF